MTRYAAFLLLGVELGAPSAVLAQKARIAVVVTDSAAGAPLAGVRVTWRATTADFTATRVTDNHGRVTLLEVPLGEYEVALGRVGYAPRSVPAVEVTAAGLTLQVSLSARGVLLDPIVVSASRDEQAWLDAPASVSVIGRSEIESNAYFTPLEQIRTVPGVDFASKGLEQHTFEVRGPRATQAAALLMLADYRYAELPSLGFNVSYLVPTTREDIARIELVRGPAAALYGPGAARGVLHIITRSPFESPGMVVSVSGGERATLHGTVRYAAVLRPRLALAVSGDFFRGDDWARTDSVENANRAAAISRGADPDTLLIARRDYGIGRAGGEARLDWRFGSGSEVVAKGGVAEAINNIDVTNAGGIQVQHWRSSYLQGWLRSGRLFANAMYNTSDAGDTYFLRTGQHLADESQQIAAQIQHGGRLGHVRLVYGADVRWTVPRTAGTVHGQFEDDDRVAEAGAYVQGLVEAASRVELVAALRADHHSRLDDVVLSPRAGIVFKLGSTQALRLTYNRAFSSPAPIDLFQDLRVGALPGPGDFGLRAEGIPPGGFTFRRDCGGLCMRSPFNPGGPNAWLPAEATRVWQGVVAILKQQGVDLSDIPAPAASQVGTNIAALLRGTGSFVPVPPDEVQDIEPLRREITNVVELGYKARLGDFRLAVDAWISRVNDRLVPFATSITPSVFFEAATLARYLSAFMDPAQAGALAAQIARMPVGTVSPQETVHFIDLLFTSRQRQSYTLWGIDLATDLELTPGLSAGATYSWVSDDSLAGSLPDAPVILNVPRTKGSLRLSYEMPSSGASATIQTRAVSGFPLARGLVGAYREWHIAGYVVVDLRLTYRLGGSHNVTVSAEVQNLLDQDHHEMAGAPALGRLAFVGVRTEF